jgi:branched-chain amino acid transport system permease protein
MQSLPQQLVNGIALGSVFALYALGFSLVLANLKVFNLAHAAVFTWAAIVAWRMVDHLHWSLWIALPGAAALAGLLNVGCYLVLVAHLEKRKNKELAAFISTLGGFIALTEAALLFLDRRAVRLPSGSFPTAVWDLGLFKVNSIQVLILGVALAVFVAFQWMLRRTTLGRNIRTAAYDEELARMMGIDARRVSMTVFFLSGATAGLGAVLVSMAFTVIDGQLGSAYLITAISVMVIGGFGSMSGVFVGGLLIGIVSTGTTAYISSSYRDVVVFGLLLAFLMLRPSGLFKGSAVQERV